MGNKSRKGIVFGRVSAHGSFRGARHLLALTAMNAILAFLVFFHFYEDTVSSYNTTLLAFSWRYGFLPRGLLGSVWVLLNRILPFNLMRYSWAKRFCGMMTLAVSTLLLGWFGWVLFRCERKRVWTAEGMMAVYILFFFSMFATKNNFGRVDILLLGITLVCVWLILLRKAETLCIPLTLLAVLAHEGYVFMYLSPVLVLLFYRLMSAREKADRTDRRRYALLFAACFAGCSALFLYMTLHAGADGTQYVRKVVAAARKLSEEGRYHIALVDHEILGLSLDASERIYRVRNHVQLPLFLVCFSPFIGFTLRIYGGMARRAKGAIGRLKALALLLGSLTMLPDFLLKCDYGRWIFCVISYYTVISLALLVMQDEDFLRELDVCAAGRRAHLPFSLVWLIFPLCFAPIRAVDICDWIAERTETAATRILEETLPRSEIAEDGTIVYSAFWRNHDDDTLADDGRILADEIRWYIREDVLLQAGFPVEMLDALSWTEWAEIGREVKRVTNQPVCVLREGDSCLPALMSGADEDVLCEVRGGADTGVLSERKEDSETGAGTGISSDVWALYESLIEEGVIRVVKGDETEYRRVLREGRIAGVIGDGTLSLAIEESGFNAGLWRSMPLPKKMK